MSNPVAVRQPSTVPAGTRFGSYEILSPIGAGGMGVVYRACDVRLGRPVAIKTLPADYSSDPVRLRHFEREARALSSINHPNIVTLYALGEPKDVYYIAMEFVEGETLRQRMAAERMRLHAALNIGTQVASALSAAHSAGILHRDIKPENVMVRPDGLVKVLDFGLAKLTQSNGEEQSADVNSDLFNQDTLAIDDTDGPFSDPYVTTRNPVANEAPQHKVLGTAPYMSPEQLCGQTADARADIFSLGILLYELVAGVMPFSGGTRAEVIDAVLEQEPAPLSCHRPEVPHSLEHIIDKAIRKDPDRRYQHVKDLLIDLQDILQELEFEATMKRAAHGKLTDQTRIIMSTEQGEGESLSTESIQVSQLIPVTDMPTSRATLSEIINDKLGARVPVPPEGINLVLLIGWRRLV